MSDEQLFNLRIWLSEPFLPSQQNKMFSRRHEGDKIKDKGIKRRFLQTHVQDQMLQTDILQLPI